MGGLDVIGTHECYRLLRSQVVGRIAFPRGDGIAVVPVNYALVDGAIHVRTAPDGYVGRGVSQQTVTFEVDQVDRDRWTGWSVVVTGRAELVAEPRLLTVPRARSWTGERGKQLLVIACETVTGRRLRQRPT